jgi:hypothetical protein
MPLLSANELATLQVWAELGMTDTITIERPSQSDSVYGDDEVATYTFVATSKAWFRSLPTAVATSDTGALITINTYRLLVPVGTSILPKDQVIAGVDTYLVTDTTVESTWKPYLQVSLRRRE